MKFFASSVFSCAVILAAVLRNSSGTDLPNILGGIFPNTSQPGAKPQCCAQTGGCRVVCSRVSPTIALAYELVGTTCEPQNAILTFPYINNLYFVVTIQIIVAPGLTAIVAILDVIAYIFTFDSKSFLYFQTVGDRTAVGCPTILPVTNSDQTIYAGSFITHKQSMDVINQFNGDFNAPCSSIQSARSIPNPIAVDHWDISQIDSLCFSEPASGSLTGNQSAVVTRNAQLGLPGANLISVIQTDKSGNKIVCVYTVGTNCGAPSSCKPLKKQDNDVQTLITNAGCNQDCINPNNQYGANVFGRCLCLGLTNAYLPYVTTFVKIAFLVPGGCSSVTYFYTFGSIQTTAIYPLIQNLCIAN